MLLLLQSPFPLAVAIIAGLIMLLCFKPRKGLPLPPRVGPGILATVAKITTIKDLSSLQFLHDLSRDVHGVGRTTNGAVFCLNMPQLKPFIVTTDYKLARLVMEGSSKDNLAEAEKSPFARAFDYTSTASILTDLTASPERHKHRKHLAVSFSSKNLEYTQTVMKECLLKFGSILKRKAESQERFLLDNDMIRLTLDIISESAFGVNFNTMSHSEDNVGEFYMQENELFLKEASRAALNPLRSCMFWSADRRRAGEARRNVMDMARKLIADHRSGQASAGRRSASDTDDKSIMGRLMSCEYESEDSRAQDILIMLLGGHETSSHTVSYLILGLLRHPESKARLQSELDACIPAEALADPTLISCADIMNLPFLAQCIKESMRLWSVIGAGPKRLLTRDIAYEGMLLPKGSMFHAAFFSMTRQSWIHRPDDFLPERWSDSNPQHAQLKALMMPFGTGQRQCIGQNLAKMEVALIAAFTLRFFDFDLISGPIEQIFLTTKPVDMEVTASLRV